MVIADTVKSMSHGLPEANRFVLLNEDYYNLALLEYYSGDDINYKMTSTRFYFTPDTEIILRKPWSDFL